MSFNISYIGGGTIDKVRELPYPHFSKYTIPFVLGRSINVDGAGWFEDSFQLEFPTEFLSVAFACSYYCIGDFWELYLGDQKICNSIYSKELPESVSMGNSFGIVYPLPAKTKITFRFYSAGLGDEIKTTDANT